MRVLLTGATGFIGSHTAAAVRADGHDVRLLVRDPGKVKRVFEPRGLAFDDVVVGDVTDPEAVDRALDGCDGVVHAAAVVALEAGRAQQVLDTNLRGVELVVGGAHRRGLERIVYVSSLSALFTAGGPPIEIDSPLAPGTSAYARSKADGERYVRDLETSGAPLRVSYPPGVIGPDDPGVSGGNSAIRAFLKDTMVITSSGFAIVDVRDLALLHAALLRREAPPGRYLVSGHMTPWRELVTLMDDMTGRRVRRIPVPGALLRGLGRVGDVVKRFYPFEFPLTKEAMEFATQWPGAVDSREIEALGVRFRAVRESYEDTIRWMYRAGHLTRKQAGLLSD